VGLAAVKALLILVAIASVAAAGGASVPRVEARSADLVAVGLVQGDTMSIHVSRSLDNAPVRDAAITVLLRGATHPTSVETDGSYTFHSKDLTLPGAAAIEFQVNEPAGRASLKGTLDIATAPGQSEDNNSSRQLWWWVLNFAVCIGVLMLISRRRKAAQNQAAQK
jgi:hypothetical protein